MLRITIPEGELWDERKQEFVYVKSQTLELEHSLLSISKWESKWHKSFLSGREKTEEEILDYVRCMTITKNVDPDVYHHLSNENIRQINAYIDDPMTATVINELPEEESAKGKSRDTITSELVYYWMIAFNIPVEFERWHISRLLTLIRVCEIKNSPPKKVNKKTAMARRRALNEARRKKIGSKG